MSAAEGVAAVLQEALLIGNVLWFARLRWMAISVLAVFGVAGLIVHDLFPSLGLRPPIGWPFLIAALLLLANLVFLGHAHRIARNPSPRAATWNLWTQIVVDLLALTMVVHFLGSLETVTPFLYLAHIVLACIFFSRRQSLVVVAIASGLYVACVGLEHWQIVSAAGIYLDPRLRQGMTSHPAFPWLTVLSALGIYFVVWFLASHLSGLVREQEVELAEANRRLTIAQQEKTRHMLRTTHELKAPFAAIAANAQLLLGGHCGILPDAATEVVRRIAIRCRRLAVEIQEMLQLANLQSADTPPQPVHSTWRRWRGGPLPVWGPWHRSAGDGGRAARVRVRRGRRRSPQDAPDQHHLQRGRVLRRGRDRARAVRRDAARGARRHGRR